MSDERIDFPSPFDRFSGDRIESRVARRGVAEDHIHGYAVTGDLARHYSWAEVVLLTLTGRAPTPPLGRAFDAVLTNLMTVTIGEASVHAARIARHVASISQNDASVVSTAAVGLAEQANLLVSENRPLFEWLASDRTSDPPGRDVSEAEAARVRTLLATMEGSPGFAARFELSLGFVPTLLAVMWECGLRQPHQVVAALVLARAPVAIAEAYSVSDPRLWKYPLNLPSWDYVGTRNE